MSIYSRPLAWYASVCADACAAQGELRLAESFRQHETRLPKSDDRAVARCLVDFAACLPAYVEAAAIQAEATYAADQYDQQRWYAAQICRDFVPKAHALVERAQRSSRAQGGGPVGAAEECGKLVSTTAYCCRLAGVDAAIWKQALDALPV